MEIVAHRSFYNNKKGLIQNPPPDPVKLASTPLNKPSYGPS